MTTVSPLILAPLMLVLSNVFMNYAWYGHLKTFNGKAWWVAVLVSWGVAFFEYLVMVPANRIGYDGGYSLGELKLMQEVITLVVFGAMSVMLWEEKPKLDHIWAGVCLIGAVYFVFRSRL